MRIGEIIAFLFAIDNAVAAERSTFTFGRASAVSAGIHAVAFGIDAEVAFFAVRHLGNAIATTRCPRFTVFRAVPVSAVVEGVAVFVEFVANFAVFRIDNAVAAVGRFGAIGFATAVSAGIICRAEVANFGMFSGSVDDAIAAVRTKFTVGSTTAVSAVVEAIAVGIDAFIAIFIARIDFAIAAVSVFGAIGFATTVTADVIFAEVAGFFVGLEDTVTAFSIPGARNGVAGAVIGFGVVFTIIANFAVGSIDFIVAAIGSLGAVGITTAIFTSIIIGAQIAFFGVIDDAIAAVRRERAVGVTTAVSAGVVLIAFIALFVRALNRPVAATRCEFARCRTSAIGSVVIVGAIVAFFAIIDDAVAAVRRPLAISRADFTLFTVIPLGHAGGFRIAFFVAVLRAVAAVRRFGTIGFASIETIGIVAIGFAIIALFMIRIEDAVAAVRRNLAILGTNVNAVRAQGIGWIGGIAFFTTIRGAIATIICTCTI